MTSIVHFPSLGYVYESWWVVMSLDFWHAITYCPPIDYVTNLRGKDIHMHFHHKNRGHFSKNIWDVVWYHHIWACQKIGHPEFQRTIIIFPIKIAFFFGSFILRHAQISYYWLNKSHSIPTKIPIKSSLNHMKYHTITIQTWLVVSFFRALPLWKMI